MMKKIERIEHLEQKVIWYRAHAVCTVFAERLYQICNDDERRAFAAHCKKIRGTNNIYDFLSPSGDPVIDKVIAKARDNAEITNAYSELCRLVDAWNFTQRAVSSGRQ